MNTSAALPVDQQMEYILQQSHYFQSRVSCTHLGDGDVVLRGSVQSYFHKQMAQEIIRKLKSVVRVMNELEVG